MISGEFDSVNQVSVYRRNCLHYLENSLLFLNQQEFTKASEFGWGALAQAVKAVAALKGIELRHHRQLWEYTRELALELHDPSIFNDFRQANSLHGNFYEAGLLPEEVTGVIDSIRVTISKLLSLLPEEVP